MHFDGAVSKEGAGAGISVAGPDFEYISFFLLNCILSVQIM